MLLRNVSIVGGDDALSSDILVENDRISSIMPTGSSSNSIAETKKLEFENAIVFPGLINSHEHLDFNLFPQIANKVYPNYREWGNDIHQKNKPAINEVLQVPQSLRTKWGIYKNLLNGFTSVVNHGEVLEIEEELIDVHQQYASLHSVGFEKNWKWKLNRPGNSQKPVVIHIGEGTDETASKEIDELIRWNLFKKPLIGIHGVAMKPAQAESFRALVWCAASNYFLLNRTADIKSLKNSVPILFGSDSTLTAGWNIWEQIRLARDTHMLSDEELFQSLTGIAAGVWGLNRKGRIEENYSADLIVARNKVGSNLLNAFYALNPEDILLIIQNGSIRLFDASLQKQLNDAGMQTPLFDQISVNGHIKYVAGNIALLMNQILDHHPDAILSPIDTTIDE